MSGVELAEFLLARIAEDEKEAHKAQGEGSARWFYDGDGVYLEVDEGVSELYMVADIVPGSYGKHIARWDPVRVLAECIAKRVLVARFQAACEVDPAGPLLVRPFSRAHLHGCQDGLEMAVRLLALPYADHPDYDEAWRP